VLSKRGIGLGCDLPIAWFHAGTMSQVAASSPNVS
jgi:hypothetical protein